MTCWIYAKVHLNLQICCYMELLAGTKKANDSCRGCSCLNRLLPAGGSASVSRCFGTKRDHGNWWLAVTSICGCWSYVRFMTFYAFVYLFVDIPNGFILTKQTKRYSEVFSYSTSCCNYDDRWCSRVKSPGNGVTRYSETPVHLLNWHPADVNLLWCYNRTR